MGLLHLIIYGSFCFGTCLFIWIMDRRSDKRFKEFKESGRKSYKTFLGGLKKFAEAQEKKETEKKEGEKSKKETEEKVEEVWKECEELENESPLLKLDRISKCISRSQVGYLMSDAHLESHSNVRSLIARLSVNKTESEIDQNRIKKIIGLSVKYKWLFKEFDQFVKPRYISFYKRGVDLKIQYSGQYKHIELLKVRSEEKPAKRVRVNNKELKEIFQYNWSGRSISEIKDILPKILLKYND